MPDVAVFIGAGIGGLYVLGVIDSVVSCFF